MRVLIAIPGQPAAPAPASPGEAIVERTIAAVTALSDAAAAELFWGFLERPFVAARGWRPNTLLLVVHGARYWRSGTSDRRMIELEWAIIEQHDDGHEVGWHPCYQWQGLDWPWRSRLRQALRCGAGTR